MQNIHLVFLIALALTTTGAAAQQRPPDAPPPSPRLAAEGAQNLTSADAGRSQTTLDLDITGINTLYANLAEFDGRSTGQTGRDGRPVRTPYDIKGMSLTIGRDMRALYEVGMLENDQEKKVITEFEKDVDEKGTASMCGVKLSSEKSKECDRRLVDIRTSKTPVTLFTLSAKKLDTDHNNFPPSVLSAVDALLVD